MRNHHISQYLHVNIVGRIMLDYLTRKLLKINKHKGHLDALVYRSWVDCIEKWCKNQTDVN